MDCFTEICTYAHCVNNKITMQCFRHSFMALIADHHEILILNYCSVLANISGTMLSQNTQKHIKSMVFDYNVSKEFLKSAKDVVSVSNVSVSRWSWDIFLQYLSLVSVSLGIVSALRQNDSQDINVVTFKSRLQTVVQCSLIYCG